MCIICVFRIVGEFVGCLVGLYPQTNFDLTLAPLGSTVALS